MPTNPPHPKPRGASPPVMNRHCHCAPLLAKALEDALIRSGVGPDHPLRHEVSRLKHAANARCRGIEIVQPQWGPITKSVTKTIDKTLEAALSEAFDPDDNVFPSDVARALRPVAMDLAKRITNSMMVIFVGCFASTKEPIH